MCGIAGFMVAPGDLDRINSHLMTWSLSLDMMERGTDATGIYTVNARGRDRLRKAACRADLFLAYHNGIGHNAMTSLIHTRAATKGDEKNNGNNHPISYGSIVGVHNGILWNDDELFEHHDWNRLAQVDSEAIFASLHHLDPIEALEGIVGSWAIAWTHQDDPRRLWLARGSQSPLHYAITDNGSVVFASTYSAVKDGLKYGGVEADMIHSASEGFWACTDPTDGGLIIMPSFDGTGRNAVVGTRSYTTYTTPAARSAIVPATTPKVTAQTPHTWSDLNGTPSCYSTIGATTSIMPEVTDNPLDTTPYIRYYMGAASERNPWKGDHRRYVTAQGQYWLEECTALVAGKPAEAVWTIVAGPFPNITGLVLAADQALYGTGESTALPPLAALPPVGGARDEYDDDYVEWWANNAYAAPGDVISIPKEELGINTHGNMWGLVTDKEEGRVFVEWEPCWIPDTANYKIDTFIGKGV